MTAADDKRSPCAETGAPGDPIREHMRSWSQRLLSGEEQRDPTEDTADEVWRTLRIFADQYLDVTSENERLRAAIKVAARDLYAIEVHRQSCGWDDDLTTRLVSVQHQLAAAHNDGYPATGDES